MKNQAAVELGRLSMKKRTPQERIEFARKGGKASKRGKAKKKESC